MNEDLKTLLELLRFTGFSWLADEVEIAIEEERDALSSLRVVDSTVKGPSSPFGDREALALAIQVVYARLIHPCRMWHEAEGVFMNEAKTRFLLIEDGREHSDPFDHDLMRRIEDLEGSLAQLWPDGPEEFIALNRRENWT